MIALKKTPGSDPLWAGVGCGNAVLGASWHAALAGSLHVLHVTENLFSRGDGRVFVCFYVSHVQSEIQCAADGRFIER